MSKKFSLYARKLLLSIVDYNLIFIACMIAYGMVDFIGGGTLPKNPVMVFNILISLFSVIAMALFDVYKVIWRYANSREMLKCAYGITIVWIVAVLALIVTKIIDPFSELFLLLSYEASVFIVLMSRIVYRSFYAKSRVSTIDSVEKDKNTLIVGAGYAGHVIVSEILQPSCEYKPVAIVDDDKSKFGRSIHGIKVVGDTQKIPEIVKAFGVKHIIVALPSCSSKDRKRILSICNETNCDVRILPYVHKLLFGENFLNQIKEIEIEDLLGRDPIKFDENRNKELIEGKICMVTGGGGSIGSELCRQIAANNPKKLIIVDIYENNAYDIQQELHRKYGHTLDLKTRIASVRDFDKMECLFEEFGPELVFHAAAHKHVPLMEDSPAEAIKNNIFGTYNVAKLAEKYDVEKFVLVSTDKAVNPTNVMGATKRCCEMIVEYMKQTTKAKTEFVAVRFGNVLGSNGSVVPLFKEQIKQGGPVTVTHPDIIRYFMTIPEATSLILQAASFAKGGEIFVLDMGEPVKILNLAENIIKLSGKKPYEEIKIEFSGLRPGEKLYEELLMSEEGLEKTESQKIFIGKQTEVDVAKFDDQLLKLKELAFDNENEKCVDMLASIVTTFKRKQN